MIEDDFEERDNLWRNIEKFFVSRGYFAVVRELSVGPSICFAHHTEEIEDEISILKNGGYIYKYQGQWFVIADSQKASEFESLPTALEFILSYIERDESEV